MERITTSISSLDITVAFGVFLAYAIVDGLYVYYTLTVTRKKPAAAATSGILIHVLVIFGVLSYVENILYVIPLVFGSWLGTYFTVKYTPTRIDTNGVGEGGR